mgnify:FL=1
MRLALHSEIRDGAIDDYRSHHVRIPDALAARFTELGIHDWTIWRSGHRQFHLVDCDDWDAVLEVLRDDPVDAAWQADIGRFVEVFRDADGEPSGTVPLEQVWRLTTQLADEDRP